MPGAAPTPNNWPTMRFRSVAPALFVLLVTSACTADRVSGPDLARLGQPGDEPAVTDSLSYTLVRGDHGFSTTISFVYTNPLPHRVYVTNCRGGTSLSLEKWDGERWTEAWSPAILSCLSPPIVIEPGGEYTGGIWVFAGFPSNNFHPKFGVEPIPGIYRIVWHEMLSSFDSNRYPFGKRISLNARVSNAFELRMED
jgi:hypothetical protein